MEKTYRSLEYYTSFAEKLIYSYIKKNNQNFDPPNDMVGYVTNRLIKAEGKYDYNRVTDKCKLGRSEEECRKYFLRMHGIYGIRAYINGLTKKNNKFILSTDMNNKLDKDFLSQIYISNQNSSPDSEKSNDEQRSLVNILINSSDLTDKQKHAVCSHIFEQKTFEQIGLERDPPVTAQAINYAYQEALKKMRSVVKNKV